MLAARIMYLYRWGRLTKRKVYLFCSHNGLNLQRRISNCLGHINSRKCISLTITGIPEIVSNGTSVSTKDDDIAHFTCTSRGEPRPLLRWERNGATVKDSDEGVAILSKSNASLEESHLFIAVTGSGRRGNYICVATNEEGVAKQSFTIVSKLNLIIF